MPMRWNLPQADIHTRCLKISYKVLFTFCRKQPTRFCRRAKSGCMSSVDRVGGKAPTLLSSMLTFTAFFWPRVSWKCPRRLWLSVPLLPNRWPESNVLWQYSFPTQMVKTSPNLRPNVICSALIFKKYLPLQGHRDLLPNYIFHYIIQILYIKSITRWSRL